MLSKCFCCCISLRFGCFIISILGIIGGVIQITMVNRINNLNDTYLKWDKSEYFLMFFGITLPGGLSHVTTITAYKDFLDNRTLAIMACALYILTFSLLLLGAIRNNTKMIWICLGGFALLIVLGIASIIIIAREDGFFDNRNVWMKMMIGLCLTFGIISNIYYSICIFSYQKRIGDKEGEVLF